MSGEYMTYLVYFLYFTLFLISTLCLKSKHRFLAQSILLLLIVSLDSYYFYFNIVQEASSEQFYWFPSGYKISNKADLIGRSFLDHLFIHHYIYSFIVYMVLLNFFHFGSMIIDHFLKAFPMTFFRYKKE